jgi:hypothetical protein
MQISKKPNKILTLLYEYLEDIFMSNKWNVIKVSTVIWNSRMFEITNESTNTVPPTH